MYYISTLCNKKKDEETSYLLVPCKNKELELKKCLEENEYNIKFCHNIRRRYELCLMKNKEYKSLFKD